MTYARQLFDQIPDPNIALWNSMFRGYAQSEFVQRSGEQVHCFLIKCGFRGNPFVGTTLIDMYSAGGTVGDAYKIFCEMFERNVVAWTSMINGYIEGGDMVEARKLFHGCPNRDVMFWNTVLKGYATNGNVEALEGLFEEMPERNIFLGTHDWRCCLLGARLGALDLGKWYMYMQRVMKNAGQKARWYHLHRHLVCLYAIWARAGRLEQAMAFVRKMPVEADGVIWAGYLGLWEDVARLKVAMRDTGFKNYQGVELGEELKERDLNIVEASFGGRILVLGCPKNTIRIWAATQSKLKELPQQKRSITCAKKFFSSIED
ncbi:Pentatricopeptide repeat-containing protein, chloroplastic [Vitis vinifera]|uniref:Pentatricopeptide repeat-containing protein, chloroplastic n=1 Tax=Vitis vinifera TaxID=29760 RepID=A0A438JUT1_VITVI|nr:Pentatricopeptide repeat-containing protein, chloroplastic [Vitis vinifera]